MSTPDTLAADVLTRAAALDTAAISDALDSLGVPGHLPGIAARTPGYKAVGIAYTVTYRPVAHGPARRAFRNAANYLDDVPAGSVVVIDNHGTTHCTTWGGILTAVARRRGIAGSVIYGSARDIDEIRHQQYPLFTTGVSMVSGKNRVELAGVGREVVIGEVIVRPGDLIVADDNGALAVPAGIAAEVVDKAEAVERTESRIASAVAQGSRLDQAREGYGYAQPWNEARAGL